jgi:hypothetical protein
MWPEPMWTTSARDRWPRRILIRDREPVLLTLHVAPSLPPAMKFARVNSTLSPASSGTCAGVMRSSTAAARWPDRRTRANRATAHRTPAERRRRSLTILDEQRVRRTCRRCSTSSRCR